MSFGRSTPSCQTETNLLANLDPPNWNERKNVIAIVRPGCGLKYLLARCIGFVFLL